MDIWETTMSRISDALHRIPNTKKAYLLTATSHISWVLNWSKTYAIVEGWVLTTPSYSFFVM